MYALRKGEIFPMADGGECDSPAHRYRAQVTGEWRAPQKGEYFIWWDGRAFDGWEAQRDMLVPQHIAVRVRVRFIGPA